MATQTIRIIRYDEMHVIRYMVVAEAWRAQTVKVRSHAMRYGAARGATQHDAW